MISMRWAPWLMMLAADVFPGGCCGGARYHGEQGPPPPPTGINVVNRSGAPICSIGTAADTGSPPKSYANASDKRLEPGASVLVSFPRGAGKFVLHVVGCDGRELLHRPGMAPSEGVVTVEIGGAPAFAAPP
jgi:hypothetical protein